MLRRRFLLSGGALCLYLALFVLGGRLAGINPLEHLENRLYAGLARWHVGEPVAKVTVVAIDESSLQALGGRMPPRLALAEVVDRLVAAGAGTVGLQIDLPGEEYNPALVEIREAKGLLKGAGRADMVSLESRLNGDAALERSMKKSARTVLAYRELPSVGSSGEKGPVAAGPIPGWSVPAPQSEHRSLAGRLYGYLNRHIFGPSPLGPVTVLNSSLMKAAVGAGLVSRPSSGVAMPLVFIRDERIYPSFALSLVMAQTGVRPKQLSLLQGERGKIGIALGDRLVPTDARFGLFLLPRTSEAISRLSFQQVLSGDFSPQAVKGHVVLVGAEASLAIDQGGASGVSSLEKNALAVAQILGRDFIARPAWTEGVELLFLAYLAFFLVLVVPRVRWFLGWVIVGAFLVTWVAASLFLFVEQGIWLHVVDPLLFTLTGVLLISLARLFFSEDRRRENIELNRMLGLSFQGQGLLDLAFEKFMKCPLENDAIKGLLYNLALDFERKRMPGKAMNVYRHILKKGRYKDARDRLNRLQNIDGRDIVAGKTGGADATVILDDSMVKPTLGRYEIVRELGQGAMGIVYQGRDPKINRDVAIKTLRYVDVDPDSLADTKGRFFREAEAAGRLTHPHIVTIYDVGEEQELAYLAMELLDGHELTSCCQKGNLLSVERTLRIVSQVADALDYAHRQGVVHRDIKPANIMLLKDDTVKVADFGIARVASSSQTQTGMVLGTPNYMSPEQIAGRKVDGRSDIFSLGSVFYELLTGDKPFKGDDIATLMYNITNGRYVPPAEVNPDLPACCIEIVEKMLSRALTRRFKSASEVVTRIEACLAEVTQS